MSQLSSALPVVGVPGRMTRRLAAVVVGSQAAVLLFGAVGARALADAGQQSQASPAVFLAVGGALTAVAVAAAGLLRTPIGVTLGWLTQLGSLLAGFVVPAMFLVGAIFLALWVSALWQGHKMDALSAAYQHQSGVPGARPPH